MRTAQRACECRERLVAARWAIMTSSTEIAGVTGRAALSVKSREAPVRHLVESGAHVRARLHRGMTAGAAIVECIAGSYMAYGAFAFGIPSLLFVVYTKAFAVR